MSLGRSVDLQAISNVPLRAALGDRVDFSARRTHRDAPDGRCSFVVRSGGLRQHRGGSWAPSAFGLRRSCLAPPPLLAKLAVAGSAWCARASSLGQPALAEGAHRPLLCFQPDGRAHSFEASSARGLSGRTCRRSPPSLRVSASQAVPCTARSSTAAVPGSLSTGSSWPLSASWASPAPARTRARSALGVFGRCADSQASSASAVRLAQSHSSRSGACRWVAYCSSGPSVPAGRACRCTW